MFNKKSIVFIFWIILFLWGCGGSKNGRIVYDSEYDKQWYLQEKFVGQCDTELIDDKKEGFSSEILPVSIESTVDLGVENYWETKTVSGKKLTIALIDSCVDIDHEELDGHIWVNEDEISNNGIDDDKNGYIDDCNGWNFIENTNLVNNSNYEIEHGTHCAGIIAANHDGIGTMGILGNQNVQIMVLPVLDSVDTDKNDEENINRLIKAINYAETMGADICNLSCSFGFDSNELQECIQKSSMYFVVAAGNQESKMIKGINLDKQKRYPACYNMKNIITVGSIDAKQNVSSFSGYSANYLNIVAPGEYIYSTGVADSYSYKNGTSMSTAIVTGILGAYYLSRETTMESAVEMLYVNAQVNSCIANKVLGGKVVYYDASS